MSYETVETLIPLQRTGTNMLLRFFFAVESAVVVIT